MRVSCYSCGKQPDVGTEAAFCPACGARLTSSEPSAIEFVDASKSFHGHRVLDGLSLTVPKGESLVIVGMSGSGKSVLMEHLVGFQKPDTGIVRVNGVDLATLDSEEDIREVRCQTSLVFQGSALIDSLNVADNIELPLICRGVSAQDIGHRVEELLAAVGLSPADALRMPAQLSGGMQKRVAIARALITDPNILLYDEPTTGLDAATSATISQLMRRVQESHPELTSIVITHDYLSAGRIADRVLYLNRDTGRLDEVLSCAVIGDIRLRHGGDTPAAVAAIREQLESFFDKIRPRENPSSFDPGDETWLNAISTVLLSSFKSLGAASQLLAKVGFPQNSTDFLRCFQEIGLKSLLVACAAGAFVGMVLAIQIGRGLASHGIFDPLPRIVGFALVERVGPLVIGLLLAGRLAASVSAEIGGKRLSRQFDALRAMAISPEAYWLSPLFWASIVALPLLTVALDLFALGGAYVVSVYHFHIKSAYFLHYMLADVRTGEFLFGLFRTAIFGAAVILVGYAKGAEEKRSSAEVGQSTTQAVIGASLCVIVLDFLMTFLASL